VIGSEFIWLWFLEKEANNIYDGSYKGFMIKQNIQPRIMSLILFNHSKSNFLMSCVVNFKTKLLEKTRKTWNRVVLPVAYS
jgi:hypothetical protein